MDILHDIVLAEAMPDFKVRVTFDTGETGVFDCVDYLRHPYWQKLGDPAFFKLVRVEYGTLVWPEDIDIAPEDIWEKTVRDSNQDAISSASNGLHLSVAEPSAEYHAADKPPSPDGSAPAKS